MRKPRHYQQTSINRVMEEYRKGVVATLLEMATGLGKTVSFACIARLMQGRCLFIAHREELIDQAVSKLRDINPDDAVEVERAESRATAWGEHAGRLVVASKDTLCQQKRLERFAPDAFELLVIDEAHRAVRKNSTYWKIIERFAAPPIGRGRAKLLFVTATAKRHDGEALGGIVQSVAYRRTISEGIDDGFLVPIRSQRIVIESLDVDLRGAASSTNDLGEKDFTVTDLARAAKVETYIMKLLAPLHEVACADKDNRRSGVIFMPSVWSAEEACKLMNGKFREKSSAVITGSGDKAERRRNLRAFAAGDIQYLFNCDVLSEGWDCDRVSIVVTRPTKSSGKLAQWVGRGTRPMEGCVDMFEGAHNAPLRRQAIEFSPKPDLLVLDPCGVTDELELVSVANIFDGTYTPGQIKWATENAPKTGKPVNEELKEAKRLEREAAEKRLRDVRVQVNYRLTPTDLFNHFKLKPVTYTPPQFMGKPVTEAMVKFIEARGVKTDENLTFYQAKKIIEGIRIEEANRPATPGQRNTLLRHNINPDVKFAEAKKIIDKLAANGWRRPDDIPAMTEDEAYEKQHRD